MVDVLIADVTEKIFVRCDTERGWAAAPFDFKTAVGLDFGKISDRSIVGDDVAVAHDAAPATTGRNEQQAGQKRDRGLIHK
jgi:hypothetical protein